MTFGFPFKSAEFSDSCDDTRLLRGDNVGQGRLRWEGAKRWPARHWSDYEDYLLREGDVVLAMDRPWIEAGLKYAVVRAADTPSLQVQRVARLRANEGLDQCFLGFLIGSREFTNHILAVQTGSTVPHISGRQIAEFDIGTLPPIDEQRGIAATLGALDDRIESDRRLVSLIPDLVRARVLKALGIGSQSVPVASLGSFVNGGAYTKGATGSGRMVVRIAELNSGPGGSTVYNDLDVPEERLARAGDILMSWSGSLGIYRWYRHEAIINQHIFKVIPSPDYPAWLVFDRLESAMLTFQTIARDKATTMGHIQRGHLESTQVRVPSIDLLRALDSELSPLWERLLLAEREMIRLSSLRDSLLPALLSGRLRVPEGRRVVEIAS